MINAKLVAPRVFPLGGIRSPEQIDRATDITGDETLNQKKLYEIGRELKVGVQKQTPSVTWKLTQYEYGSMDFYLAIANLVDPASAGIPSVIELDDIKTTSFDIAAYLTDDNGTFKGTAWFPKLRVESFSVNIADPDATVERTFNCVGEDVRIIHEKYLAYVTSTVGVLGTGIDEVDVPLSPFPVEFAAGEYVYRVTKERAGVVEEIQEDDSMVLTPSWDYDNGTHLVTVTGCLAGDVIKIMYPAATAYTTLWSDNDSDAASLFADSCEIFMKVGTSTKIHRLQSVGIDVKLTRTDYKEIGNENVVQRGVKDATVTVKLDRYNEGFSLEDILASDTNYCDINPREFSEEVQLLVKIFSDSSKQTFKMGYLITKLSPTTLNIGQAVQEYQKMGNSLESDNLKISTTEAEVAFL